MSLFDQINNDIKQAMLAKEKDKLEALRSAKTAFLLAKSEKGKGGDMKDEDAVKIIQKLVKQRQESADIYKSQNRDDLYQKEKFEAEVLQKYLPELMSREQLEAELKEIIEEMGVVDMKGMGKVMGHAAKKFAGRADNKMISQIVRELLS